MAKSTVGDWDTTAANNTDVGGINIAEGCPAANVNDAMREMMAQIKANNATVEDRANHTGTQGLETVTGLFGHLYGLTLSNNPTDATNDIDIAAGSAVDDADGVVMSLASSITKRLDASWAVGSGNGGRMSAAAIANTTYHVFLIQRSDTGVVDVGFDVSATAPTLPTNYDRYRRIGSIIRASAAIVGFSQRGDEFLLRAPVLDTNSGGVGTSGSLAVLTVPLGIQVEAMVGGHGYNSLGYGIAITSIDQGNPTVVATGLSDSSANANQFAPFQKNVRTDTLARIRLTASTTIDNFRVTTFGWRDTRGRT